MSDPTPKRTTPGSGSTGPATSPSPPAGADLSPLKQDAIALHELYSELQAAGFTKPEALTLVGKLMLGSSTNN